MYKIVTVIGPLSWFPELHVSYSFFTLFKGSLLLSVVYRLDSPGSITLLVS